MGDGGKGVGGLGHNRQLTAGAQGLAGRPGGNSSGEAGEDLIKFQSACGTHPLPIRAGGRQGGAGLGRCSAVETDIYAQLHRPGGSKAAGQKGVPHLTSLLPLSTQSVRNCSRQCSKRFEGTPLVFKLSSPFSQKSAHTNRHCTEGCLLAPY